MNHLNSKHGAITSPRMSPTKFTNSKPPCHPPTSHDRPIVRVDRSIDDAGDCILSSLTNRHVEEAGWSTSAALAVALVLRVLSRRAEHVRGGHEPENVGVKNRGEQKNPLHNHLALSLLEF